MVLSVGICRLVVAFSLFQLQFQAESQERISTDSRAGIAVSARRASDQKPDGADSERVDSVEAFAALILPASILPDVSPAVFTGAQGTISRNRMWYGSVWWGPARRSRPHRFFSTEMTFSELAWRRRSSMHRPAIDSWVETDSGERKKLEPACSNEDDRRGMSTIG